MTRHIVIMGVSGSGKSTIGELLGERLALPYRDGDDLHPQSNIDKMSAGHPLTDEDRWPWLQVVGQWLADHPDGGIIGCSALKRSYRDMIRESAPDVAFIHVHGTHELLHDRMKHRSGHFMPADLLTSQFDTLEDLESDETGEVFDIAEPPRTVIDRIVEWLSTLDRAA